MAHEKFHPTPREAPGEEIVLNKRIRRSIFLIGLFTFALFAGVGIALALG